MQKAHEWEIAGEAAWGVALLREAVIRPLAEHSRLSAESVTEAADQLGLSCTILYKLLQRYRFSSSGAYRCTQRMIVDGSTSTPPASSPRDPDS